MSRPAEAAPALIYKEGDDVIIDGGVLDADAIDGDPLLTADELAAIQGAAAPDAENVFATVDDLGVVGVSKASGAEVDTGTDDVKYVTAKAIADSLVFSVPASLPVVPETTPDVQDVIDALISLGLVTQSD